MNKPRFLILAGIILAATATRLIPHPPNFSPIAAIALFGGAKFADKRLAFLVPLGAMLLSDLVLGFHRLMPVVYGSFALTVCLGFWVRRHPRAWSIGVAALAAAVLFFVITNLGVWALGSFYAKTPAGLVACYVAAIPFFQNTLVSDLLYAGLLFGGMHGVEQHFARLREVPVKA